MTVFILLLSVMYDSGQANVIAPRNALEYTHSACVIRSASLMATYRKVDRVVSVQSFCVEAAIPVFDE